LNSTIHQRFRKIIGSERTSLLRGIEMLVQDQNFHE